MEAGHRRPGSHTGRAALAALDACFGDDPADIVADRQTVLNELNVLPPRVRDAVAPVVLGDRTFADVAKQLGITERAVEGLLYRYRTEVARRQTQRRIR